MIVYRGGRRQRGYGIGGVFSSLFRKAKPFAAKAKPFFKNKVKPLIKKGMKKAKPHLKKASKIAGKNALNTFTQVMADVQGGDVDLVDSILTRGKAGLMKTGKDVYRQAIKRKREPDVDSLSSDTKRQRRPADIFDK